MRYVLMLLTLGVDGGEAKEEIADQVREKLAGEFPAIATSELRETWG